MGKVYSTQDFLYVRAEYFANIGDQIASGIIKYVDPDGIEGFWPAVNDPVNKQLIYEVPKGTYLRVGTWRAWSLATMDDGRQIPGTPDTFKIRIEGT